MKEGIKLIFTCVSGTDKAIGDVIDSIDPFAANHFGVLGKLTEPLP